MQLGGAIICCRPVPQHVIYMAVQQGRSTTPSHLRAHVRPRIAMIEIIAMDPKQVISLLNSFGVILNLHCFLTELESSLS